MVSICNPVEIFGILKNLEAGYMPLFGVMSPQHMIEHLSYSTAMSTGRFPQKLYFSEEQAAFHKSLLLDPGKTFPAGFKAPMLVDTPPPLRFADLPSALERLKIELDKFPVFFDEHPEAMPVHPAMGPLNKDQWIIFHNRHYTHHFYQFGLI